MVLETDRGAADRAAEELTAAGHVVLRCHERGAPPTSRSRSAVRVCGDFRLCESPPRCRKLGSSKVQAGKERQR